MADATVVTSAAQFNAVAADAAAGSRVSLAERTAVDKRDAPIAVRHVELPHIGVLCHPESILTDGGKRMALNVLTSCRWWDR